MFIKHGPYGAFYYYCESIVTFSMTLFIKTLILISSESKVRRKENSLLEDLLVFHVSFTEPPSKKKSLTTPFTGRQSRADRRVTVLTGRRRKVRKKATEREMGNKEVKRYRHSHKEQPRNLSIKVLSHQTPIRSSWQESCQSRRHTVFMNGVGGKPASTRHVPV